MKLSPLVPLTIVVAASLVLAGGVLAHNNELQTILALTGAILLFASSGLVLMFGQQHIDGVNEPPSGGRHK
jgi:hypothetical protein